MADQRMSKQYDRVLKIMLIGDSAVGKSCLLLRFSDDQFANSYVTTIGIDFKIKTLTLDGKRLKLQIWDTAGQERYRAITNAYYRGASGIMVIYDITSTQSFESVRNWVRTIDEHAAKDVQKMLLGNKCDMEAQRTVPASIGRALADDFSMAFLEVSARNDINVQAAFLTLARTIMKSGAPNSPGGQELRDAPAAQNGSKCCKGGS